MNTDEVYVIKNLLTAGMDIFDLYVMPILGHRAEALESILRKSVLDLLTN